MNNISSVLTRRCAEDYDKWAPYIELGKGMYVCQQKGALCLEAQKYENVNP